MASGLVFTSPGGFVEIVFLAGLRAVEFAAEAAGAVLVEHVEVDGFFVDGESHLDGDADQSETDGACPRGVNGGHGE